MSGGDWRGGWWKPISKTFDGESKFSKITNSHVQLGGGELVETNFQLLMLSPNLLKLQIPMSSWGGGWWKPISNF